MQRFAGPAGPATLVAMHDALERLWAEAPDVDELLRIRFTTALAEVVGNVVRHGRRDDGSAPQVDACVRADGDLRADIRDDGTSFPEPLAVPEPVDELAESGRGIAMARAVLDELDYAREPGLNRWTLVIHR